MSLKKNKSAVALRKEKALELRIKGWPYSKIAKELGYAKTGSAYNLIQSTLKAHVRENADELVTLSLMQLDRLQELFSDLAETGDHKAAKLILDVMDRRAKFLGLYAPDKIEVKTEPAKLVWNESDVTDVELLADSTEETEPETEKEHAVT